MPLQRNRSATGSGASARITRLIERDGELAQIEEVVALPEAGGGGLLLLEGPGGAGKTRLLEECRARGAERGMAVLSARGGELESEYPFGIVRQLLDPALRRASSEEREALFADAAGLARPVLAFDGEDAASDAAGSTFSALHGLYWLVANMAIRRPLLLSVDDAHFADTGSLRFLAYLAHRIDALPVLLVVAFRRGEAAAQGEFIAALRAEPSARVLRPSPLSREAVDRLVRQTLGEGADDAFCAACHATTAGNPFFLHELLGVLVTGGVEPTAAAAAGVLELGPETVSRAILPRIARLPDGATALARAVAILGTTAELRYAAALAGLEESRAAKAADALAAADILGPGRPLEFVHPIVRAAVYGDIPPAERALGHSKAAHMLADGGARAEEVGAHLLPTEPAGDQWVAEALRAAGRDALARAAPDAAVRFLRRALEESPPGARTAADLLALGRAESRADLGGSEHIAEALELTEDTVERAEIALALGGVLGLAGKPPEAVEVLAGALTELNGAEPSLASRLEAELIGLSLISASTLPIAAERLPRAAREATGNSPAERLLLAMASHGLTVAGRINATQAAEAAWGVLRAGGLETAESSSLIFFTAMTLVYSGRLDEAVSMLDDTIAGARAKGSLPEVAIASAFRAEALRRRGSVLDAEADARAALEMVDPKVLGLNLPFPLAFLLETLVELGRHEEAERVLADARLGEDWPVVWQFNLLLHARGRVRLAQGDLTGGLDDVLEAGRRLAPWGVHNPGAVPWRSTAALALLQIGDRDEARRLASEELEQARAFGAPRAIGMALRAAGLAADVRQGVELLEEAVTVLEGSQAALEHARALTDLGATLRRAGRVSMARDPLRRGLELAHRCGSHALAERAHAELKATGARPRRVMLSGVGALTPSERRVVRMAAEGYGNREIAQALFVTTRTVETHLTHAYQKLGIRSRSELPGALDAAA